MRVQDSNNSSNEESNAESNDNKDLEFEPVFTPQRAQTAANTPINDSEKHDKENIASPQLGCGKCHRFQKNQYKPQTTECTGKFTN